MNAVTVTRNTKKLFKVIPHPDASDEEVFITNGDENVFARITWETKRRGPYASNESGTKATSPQGHFPIFASRDEIAAKDFFFSDEDPWQRTSKMNAEQQFLVPIHRYSFRAGEPAAIRAEFDVTPPGLPMRKCYEVEFHDGEIDLVVASDTTNFLIISIDDVRAGRIPAVTQ